MLGNDETVYGKYIEQAKFRELLDQQRDQKGTNKQNHHIHLTFETLYDNRTPIDFLPFIYQEKRSLATHHLLLLDINSMQIFGSECINSSLEIRKWLRKSEAGFAKYTLTRTSDLFNQPISLMAKLTGASQDSCSKVVKY